MIVIRRLECEKDIAAYRKFRLSMLQQEPKAFPAAYALEAQQEVCFFEERLRQQYILGALDQENMVGITSLIFNKSPCRKHCCEIGSVYVLPQYRKTGIAKKIFEQLFIIAKEHDIEILELRVLASQEPAIRFYSSLGFEEWGRMKRAIRFDAEYVDGIAMAKSIV